MNISQYINSGGQISHYLHINISYMLPINIKTFIRKEIYRLLHGQLITKTINNNSISIIWYSNTNESLLYYTSVYNTLDDNIIKSHIKLVYDDIIIKINNTINNSVEFINFTSLKNTINIDNLLFIVTPLLKHDNNNNINSSNNSNKKLKIN